MKVNKIMISNIILVRGDQLENPDDSFLILDDFNNLYIIDEDI